MLAKPILDFIEASGICMTIADARVPDFPLVAANPAFLRLTGYELEEIVGRNCRFLQPEGGAGPVRERMRAFLSDPEKREDRFLLGNVRKDGARFLNLLYMTKVRRSAEDEFILGSQFDFTRHDRRGMDGYDRALTEDIRELGVLTGEMGMVTLGTFRSLAASAAIIAEARLRE